MSLLAELQRRNVFRVSAAYLALGWIVAQVTGLVAPALHLPDSILSIVVWVGVIGFPFVVVFAWAFEMTPEGLKRESEVDRSRSITHVTARRLDYVVIGFVVLAIALFAYQQMRPGSPVEDPRAEARPTQVAGAEITVGRASARQEPAPGAESVPGDKSIAVLPFVNMSEDKANEYFSDGISEELLNLLAKIPELRVIARTSSFAYKGKETKIAEIARELQVAHILEGSVRKAGNKVRITAQLVRASDSTHLWSETYDRSLDDIFAVQEEIAGAVVGQLKVALLGAAPKVAHLNPEAYAQALQAEHFFRQNTDEGRTRALEVFNQVLAIEPHSARAWTGLANVYFAQASSAQAPSMEAMRLAREAAGKAVAADPDYAPAHSVLALIALGQDTDAAGAARHLQRALELDPADPDILSMASRLLSNLGRLEEAVAVARLVTQRDPVTPLGYHRLGYLSMYAGHWDECIAAQHTALDISPGFDAANYQIGLCLLGKGDAEAALAAFDAELSDEEYRVKGKALALFTLGRQAEFEQTFAELRERWGDEWPSEIAQVYAWSGNADQTFAWLDKALARNEPGLSEQFRQPMYTPVHADPRWQRFRERTGTAEAQLAAVAFRISLPR